MRDAVRIDRMINKLRNLWKDTPDQRLGQLISNVIRDEDGTLRDPFVVEDDVLELQLDAVIKGGWK